MLLLRMNLLVALNEEGDRHRMTIGLAIFQVHDEDIPTKGPCDAPKHRSEILYQVLENQLFFIDSQRSSLVGNTWREKCWSIVPKL